MDLSHLRVLVFARPPRLLRLAGAIHALGAQVRAVDSLSAVLVRLPAHVPHLLVVDLGDEGEAYALMDHVRGLPPRQGGRVAAASIGPVLLERGRLERWQGKGFQLHMVDPVDPVELRAVIETLGGRSIERRSPRRGPWRAFERRALACVTH
jgi:hypothetical protein